MIVQKYARRTSSYIATGVQLVSSSKKKRKTLKTTIGNVRTHLSNIDLLAAHIWSPESSAEVEYAKSDKSTCRATGQKIPKGDLRIGKEAAFPGLFFLRSERILESGMRE